MEKTKYMIIVSNIRLTKITNDLQVGTGNETIKRFSTTKILGLIIDEKLNWEAEIENISKKVSRGI